MAKKVKEQLSPRQILAALEAAAKHRDENKILFFNPYPKQQAFMDMGAFKRERLFMAGNQLGKTETGAAECCYHMTGDYPADWCGRRWDRPVKCWIAGETGLVVRDAQQKKLCGEPGVDELFGTGYIPKARFVDKPSLARGTPDAYDTIQVRHKSGGISIGKFKSYEQGRTKFQAETLDFLWFDEEPPMDIYGEGLTRVSATQGMVYLTFTPLKGMSGVVMRYLNEPSPDRGVVTMTIDDALHISPEQRAIVVAGYLPHEREARAKGVPMLGSGRIFQYADESIWEEPIPLSEVPRHWHKGWGIDFGINHPFAAALLAWDKDTDVIHLLHTLRVKDQKPLQHAAAMKPVARVVPVFWPQDGTARESDGVELSKKYRLQGLLTHPEHATWPTGGVSTEAGILEMQERMETGRFKAGKHLKDFFEEVHLYHRKDGQVVKVMDDILSATRIGIMMKRFFKPVNLGAYAPTKSKETKVAEGVDFDVF